jgi:Protein of unknown function (DUF5131)
VSSPGLDAPAQARASRRQTSGCQHAHSLPASYGRQQLDRMDTVDLEPYDGLRSGERRLRQLLRPQVGRATEGDGSTSLPDRRQRQDVRTGLRGNAAPEFSGRSTALEPRLAEKLIWPSNVWMGVSVEGPEQLKRIDHLRSVPAAVRFISTEPLLGPLAGIDLTDIHWVIAGGESGHRARPVDPSGSACCATPQTPLTSRSSSSSGEDGRPRPAGASSTGGSCAGGVGESRHRRAGHQSGSGDHPRHRGRRPGGRESSPGSHARGDRAAGRGGARPARTTSDASRSSLAARSLNHAARFASRLSMRGTSTALVRARPARRRVYLGHG